MSITFGVYDFFSYTVPGFLYLWTINQLLAIFNLPHFNVQDISLDIGYALIGVVASYVAGGLMDTIAYRWYLLFYKHTIEQQALNNIKRNYPELKVDFDVRDRRLLFSFVKHNNLELAENIDKFKALNIMFHNISFGLFLFSLVQIAKLVVDGISIAGFFLIVAAWAFSYVAIKRSSLFNFWYWSGNFEQALHYGRGITAMFKKEWADKKPVKVPKGIDDSANDAAV